MVLKASYWIGSGNAKGAPRLSLGLLHVAWICNVTHDVLGGHPKDIYVHGVV